MARLFSGDVLISDEAYFYRYSSKKLKLDKFSDTEIVHRTYNKYDEYIAYAPGNKEGVTVSKEPNIVTNRNGLYFYVWSTSEISDRRLNAMLIKAIRKFYGDKIHSLEVQIDKRKMSLEEILTDLTK